MRSRPVRPTVEASRRRLPCGRFAVTLIVAGLAVVTAAAAVAGSNSLDPRALSQARTIKAEITARYVRTGRPKLAVTEASSTGVIESFLLLTADFLGLRVVPADNGIHYAICPVRAICPYPGPRSARPASGFAPRRLALELAVRTFLETSASVVSVSLPTRDYVFFLIERDELAQTVDMAALARTLSGNPARAPAASVRQIVDEITRPRLFAPLGLEPTPSGRESLGAVPLTAGGWLSSRAAMAGSVPLPWRFAECKDTEGDVFNLVSAQYELARWWPQSKASQLTQPVPVGWYLQPLLLQLLPQRLVLGAESLQVGHGHAARWAVGAGDGHRSLFLSVQRFVTCWVFATRLLIQWQRAPSSPRLLGTQMGQFLGTRVRTRVIQASR